MKPFWILFWALALLPQTVLADPAAPVENEAVADAPTASVADEVAPVAISDSRRCPPYFQPQITTKAAFDEPSYDHTPLASGLKKIAAVSEGVSPAEIPLGLTSIKHQVKTSYQIQGMDMGKIYCAQISKIEVTLKAKDTHIFIAKEAPDHSCTFNDIIEHETKHAELARNLLDSYAPIIKGYLLSFVENHGVKPFESKQAAESYFSEALDNYETTLSTNLSDVYAKQQAQIDTPFEYDHFMKGCKGETAQVLQKAGLTGTAR